MQSEKIYELTLKRKLLQFNFEGLLKKLSIIYIETVRIIYGTVYFIL